MGFFTRSWWMNGGAFVMSVENAVKRCLIVSGVKLGFFEILWNSQRLISSG